MPSVGSSTRPGSMAIQPTPRDQDQDPKTRPRSFRRSSARTGGPPTAAERWRRGGGGRDGSSDCCVMDSWAVGDWTAVGRPGPAGAVRAGGDPVGSPDAAAGTHPVRTGNSA